MSDVQSKYKVLVEKLYQKTAERKLAWQHVARTNSVFVRVAGNWIHLSSENNNNMESDMYVTVRNDDNYVLERFSDISLSDVVPDTPGFPGFYALMTALHEMAIRQATGADEALDSILDELDTDLSDDAPF